MKKHSGADPALVNHARAGHGPTGFDQGESKCVASCLNCAGSGQVAVMTGTRRDIVAYYTPCPNGPAPDVAAAAWGLIDAVEGGDSIPRACGILRWALVAESFDHGKATALVTRWMNEGFCTLTIPERAIAVLLAKARGDTGLTEIIGHLGAAISQSLLSDDQIIMGHVRDAYALAIKLRRAA